MPAVVHAIRVICGRLIPLLPGSSPLPTSIESTDYSDSPRSGLNRHSTCALLSIDELNSTPWVHCTGINGNDGYRCHSVNYGCAGIEGLRMESQDEYSNGRATDRSETGTQPRDQP